MLNEADKNYEVNNGEESDDANRKAVLSGDELTYRVRLHNTGYMDSDTVNVYDEVPENCTYIENSMKIYRQKIANLSGGTISYGKPEEMDPTSDTTVSMEYNDGHLSWSIAGIPLNHIYYVEYRVKVDTLSAFDLKRTLTNEAYLDFVSINGDIAVGDDISNEFTPTDLDYLKEHLVFDMKVDVDEGSIVQETHTHTRR